MIFLCPFMYTVKDADGGYCIFEERQIVDIVMKAWWRWHRPTVDGKRVLKLIFLTFHDGNLRQDSKGICKRILHLWRKFDNLETDQKMNDDKVESWKGVCKATNTNLFTDILQITYWYHNFSLYIF